MKTISRSAAVMMIGLLSACAPENKAQVAATLTPIATSPAIARTITRACETLKPALDVAAGPSVPKSISDAAVYPAAYCDELAVTKTLPATTDASTPEWLDKTAKLVGIAARVAGVVLPLLL